MIFGLLYFCVVILCVNRSRSSFILYRIVKRHSRQSNVRRIWTCADNGEYWDRQEGAGFRLYREHIRVYLFFVERNGDPGKKTSVISPSLRR